MSETTITIISAFGSAAAGALLGSLSAYGLGVWNEKNERKNRKHSGLIKAQYALMSQWNIAKGLQKNLLDPLRDDPERHFKIPKFYAYGQPIRVPFDEISFIAQSDTPNLLQDIHIAEQNYDTVINSLESLVEHIKRFQNNPNVVIQNFDIQTGASRVEADARDIFWVIKWSDTLFDVTDKAIPMIEKEIENIEQFSKKHFKGMKALKMVSDDWSNQPN